MQFLTTIKNEIPDWAKDIRLNLDGTIARSSLKPADAVGVALAAAYAAKNPFLIEQFKSGLSPEDVNGVLTAAALMGMNNIWYPYVEMTDDSQLKTLPPLLRMNAYSSHGGIEHGNRLADTRRSRSHPWHFIPDAAPPPGARGI